MSGAISCSEYVTIQQFYAREARLLDERQFDQWLGLLAVDIRYWMPLRVFRKASPTGALGSISQELTDPKDISLFDETMDTLGLRVARLRGGKAWAEEPASRTRRLITMADVAERGADREVVTNFAIFQGRASAEPMTYFGQRTDLLRAEAGDYRIAKRTIILNSELRAGNLSIFF